MAGKRSSQTSPGKAVYKLHAPLRVPAKPDLSKPLPEGGYESLHNSEYLNPGDEVTEDRLVWIDDWGQSAGLNVAALVKGGFLEKISEPQVPCEQCQEHGTKEEKAKTYSSPEELAAHYAEAHGAFAPSEEV